MKLHFASNNKDGFAEDLHDITNRYCQRYHLQARAKSLLWLKLVFYAFCFFAANLWLLLGQAHSLPMLVQQYILVGFSGLLLAFNAAHDAVHSAFSRDRNTNRIIYALTFNLQGLSGYLWRIRHLASHHIFPNVDGCDADIDDNPFIRLSPHQPKRIWHKYQHVYATILYAVYTMHWMLIKDVQYLLKRDLANLRNQTHSTIAILQIVVWKLVYFSYMLIIPMIVLECPAICIVIGFVAMHMVLSLFFVLTLIISHLCQETAFPLADKNGLLPFNYHQHQLTVSLDYHPRSFVANWFFGGFNAHAAHHLFPRMPHTSYPLLTKVIQRVARRHAYPYHELSIPKAIASHYRYLRQVGNS